MDLTTVDRVKAILGQQGTVDSGGAVELEIAAVVTAVSGVAERYLNRVALSGAQIEYFDVDEGRRLFALKAFPVTAVTDVRFDEDQAFGAATILDATDYANPAYSPSGTLAMRRDLMTDGCAYGALKVSYTGGMASTTGAFTSAYPDIAAALDLQCASVYRARAYLGFSSVTLPGGENVSPLDKFWAPGVRAVLDRYRRPS